MKIPKISRRLSFLVLCLLLICTLAWSAVAQSPQSARVYGASLYKSPGSPAIINRVTATPNDLLAGGTIKNIGTKTIFGYRIGWIAADGEDAPAVKFGAWVNAADGIAPGQTFDLPPQGVAPMSGEQEARDLAIFVAEVKFSDGEIWSVGLEKLKEQFKAGRRK